MTPIDGDLLMSYLSNGCTPFERAQVGRWLGESPDRVQFLAALREAATDTRAMTEERKAEMLATVKRQPVTAPTERSFALPKRSPWLMGRRVAAALAILTAGVIGRMALQRPTPTATPSSAAGLRSFATAPGQRLA